MYSVLALLKKNQKFTFNKSNKIYQLTGISSAGFYYRSLSDKKVYFTTQRMKIVKII